MKDSEEVWLTHVSAASWMSAAKWTTYFADIERVLDDHLVRLDTSDPARRKVEQHSDQGPFVVDFGQREQGRWLLGRFERTKVWLTIQLYRDGRDSWGRLRENDVTLHVPARALDQVDSAKIVQLFDLGNETLRAFYSFADRRSVVASKGSATRTVDLARELLGIFWLTYFGSRYTELLGESKLLSLSQATRGPSQGVTLRLANDPSQVPLGLPTELERELGADRFASSREPSERGEHVLTLEQLHES